MPPSETFDDFKSKQPGFVANWTETNTGSAGSTATATKAASANNTHFLCGLIVACKETTSSSNPPTVTCNVKDGTTPGTGISFGFTAGSNDDYDTNGGPVVINFGAPIQFTEGNAITVELTGASMQQTSSVSFWGFTSSIRVN